MVRVVGIDWGERECKEKLMAGVKGRVYTRERPCKLDVLNVGEVFGSKRGETRCE